MSDWEFLIIAVLLGLNTVAVFVIGNQIKGLRRVLLYIGHNMMKIADRADRLKGDDE